MGINDFRVAVTLAAVRLGLSLEWRDERELKAREMRQLVEDPRRPGKQLAVIPDGHFTLSGTAEFSCALELDRGTVEEKPFKEKVRALGEWKLRGAYRRAFNTDSLRVSLRSRLNAPRPRSPRADQALDRN